MEDKQVAELKAQHGQDLVSLDFQGTEYVFRKPKRQEYDRWLQRNGEDRITAARELAQACCVAPSAAEMFAAVDAYPAFLQAPGGIVDAVTELAGLTKTGVEATKKKL